jgi:hypothetical protein
MHFLKPKSVLRQALPILCFLLTLVAFAPRSARSGSEPVRLDPPLRGESTLASIKIDIDSGFTWELVEIPILIRNDVEFCGLQLEVDFPYQYLTLLQVKRGLALSDTSNGQYDWEYFSYRILPFPLADTLYRCLILGWCDMPGGYQGIPLALHSEYVSLVVLEFMIGNGGFPSGTFFPIMFEWEGDVVNDTVVNDWDCGENTFCDPSGITTYASQNIAQFNPALCFPASPSLEFLDGGVYVAADTGECKRGDVNDNGITYEVGDLVLFYSFLLEGPGVLHVDTAYQTCASNTNADGLYWTIADFLYLARVILNDSPEIPLKGVEDDWQGYSSDELKVISSSAHPGEVFSVPVWLSNSTNAWGLTFKVSFDSSLLSVEGVEVAQTRIEGWEEIHPVIYPDGLFFFAFPILPLEGGGYPYLEPGDGILMRVNFRVDEEAIPGTSLPITFVTNLFWGHYNSYTDTSGTVFVQPSTVSGWIFTDVISGDANSDGILNVADLVYLINYLYRGGLLPSPLSLGDFNEDGEVNVADVVALINYLFRS